MPKRRKVAPRYVLDPAPKPSAGKPSRLGPTTSPEPRLLGREARGASAGRRPRARGRPHPQLCLSRSCPTEEGRGLRDAFGPGRSEPRPRGRRRRAEPPCGLLGPCSAPGERRRLPPRPLPLLGRGRRGHRCGQRGSAGARCPEATGEAARAAVSRGAACGRAQSTRPGFPLRARGLDGRRPRPWPEGSGVVSTESTV